MPSNSKKRLPADHPTRLTTNTMNHAFVLFAEFASPSDNNSQGCLKFDAFYRMQPGALRKQFTPEQIKQWFDFADEDGDGSLTVLEFFRFSVATAQRQYGERIIEELFAHYDKDGSGVLDAIEFGRAAAAMGFGVVSTDLFKGFDDDQSGTLHYREILGSLTSVNAWSASIDMALDTAGDDHAKSAIDERVQLVDTIVAAHAAATKAELLKNPIDTSTWAIKGRDAASVSAEIKSLLASSGGCCADFIRLFDHDNGAQPQMDVVEFQKTMTGSLGFKGDHKVLKEIFKEMDSDRSGEVGFDEIFEFINGRRHPLDPRTRKSREDWSLHPPVGVMSLSELVWELDTLRVLIADVIARGGHGPADLLRLWKCEKGLNKEMWIAKVQETFFSATEELNDLWESEAKAVAADAFIVIERTQKGENFLRRINVIHLERWLALKPTAADMNDAIATANGTEDRLAVLANARGAGGRRRSMTLPSPTEIAQGIARKMKAQLPLKSKAELRQARRERKEREESRQGNRTHEYVDWAARARPIIDAAAAHSHEREAHEQEAAAERAKRMPLLRWEADVQPAAAPTEGRFAVQPPVITIHSHEHYKNDHTASLADRSSTPAISAGELSPNSPPRSPLTVRTSSPSPPRSPPRSPRSNSPSPRKGPSSPTRSQLSSRDASPPRTRTRNKSRSGLTDSPPNADNDPIGFYNYQRDLVAQIARRREQDNVRLRLMKYS